MCRHLALVFGTRPEAIKLFPVIHTLRERTNVRTARLVGTDAKDIVTEAERLLDDREHYEAMSRAANPYGDGHASERIASVIDDQ